MWVRVPRRGSRYSENGGSMMYGESTAITWIAGFSRFRKTVSSQRDLAQPLQIDRRFDLALSLEVAEHLPPECGSEFVQTLTDLSSVILFSAAIPFQGGTDHLNEQWPSTGRTVSMPGDTSLSTASADGSGGTKMSSGGTHRISCSSSGAMTCTTIRSSNVNMN